MNDSTMTIRAALQAKIDAARTEIAEAEEHLSQLPATFLDKAVSEFHKLIGWL